MPEPAATPTLTVGRRSTTRSTRSQAATGSGSAAGARAAAGGAARARDRARGSFLRRLLHRRAAPGRARRADGGRGRQGGRRARGESSRRALMLSGDLPRMAELALIEGEAGLRAVGLELFRPVLPMLASTAGATSPRRCAGFERASVEWKLDGIRIQIHRRGDEVRIYTRNLNEITAVAAGDRRRPCSGCRSRRRCSTARRCGWARRSGRVPGHGLADRRRRPAGGDRDVPVRPAAPRRRGPARRCRCASARARARGDRAGS